MGVPTPAAADGEVRGCGEARQQDSVGWRVMRGRAFGGRWKCPSRWVCECVGWLQLSLSTGFWGHMQGVHADACKGLVCRPSRPACRIPAHTVCMQPLPGVPAYTTHIYTPHRPPLQCTVAGTGAGTVTLDLLGAINSNLLPPNHGHGKEHH
eukprot:356060-Chlamydomonas_euryale.AAC.1